MPCPTQPWAELVFPDDQPERALEHLWEQVEHICRLDEDDPVAAWRERQDVLERRRRAADRRTASTRCTSRGRAPTCASACCPARAGSRRASPTIDGIEHMPNLPSEEIFTTPDPQRVEGTVRSTKPLVAGGTIIRGLRARFEGGRAVSIEADEGGELLARYAARDEGAVAPRRGRAGRRRGPHRPAGHRLLRHAHRRERGVAHRARLGVRVHGRRGGRRAPSTARRSTSTS